MTEIESAKPMAVGEQAGMDFEWLHEISPSEKPYFASLAQRKPTLSSRCCGGACMRLVAVTRSGGSYQPPPRSTLALPLLGPLGLRTSAREKLSPNQSATHSHTLPARSSMPKGLVPLG